MTLLPIELDDTRLVCEENAIQEYIDQRHEEIRKELNELTAMRKELAKRRYTRRAAGFRKPTALTQ